MKTTETLILQTAVWKLTNKMGTFACHEVGINGEIVDFLTYDTKGEWRCFEIKVSLSDFNSKNKCTFVGHFNYYVMPPELFQKIKQNIPAHIGVYTYRERADRQNPTLYCAKWPIKQPLGVDQDTLIYSLIKSLSREYDKHVKGTKPLCTWSDIQLIKELEKRKYKVTSLNGHVWW